MRDIFEYLESTGLLTVIKANVFMVIGMIIHELLIRLPDKPYRPYWQPLKHTYITWDGNGKRHHFKFVRRGADFDYSPHIQITRDL